MLKLILLSSLLTFGFSCSKKDGAVNDGTDDSSAVVLLQSAAGTVGEALQGSAASLNPMSKKSEAVAQENTAGSEDHVGILASCSTISFGSCSGSTITRDFGTGGCTRTAASGNSATIFGSVTWTFSGGGGACSSGLNWNTANASGTATRTVSNHYAETSSGYKVLTYTGTGTVGGTTVATSDLQAYTGTSYSGGVTASFGASNTRTINVNGVHRRGLRSGGSTYTFWHTIFTSSPLTVTATSGSYTIASGSVTVLHNRARVAVTNTFSNVVYPTDGSCCYPTSGTILTQVGTGNVINATFTSTCGAITLDGVNGNLPACGGSTN